MNWQHIWDDPVWSKVIAGIILGAGAFLLAILPPDPLWMGILVSIFLLGSSLLGWALLRAPVVWNFVNFLGMVGGGGDLRIPSFQASGRNRSKKGIHNIQGHLISNIDNSISEQQLHFVINGIPVLPSSTTGIPPGANFVVMIPLCDMAKGYDEYLKEYDFIQRWGTFRFVAELDGFRFERNFSKRRVIGLIEEFRKVVTRQPEPQVRVKQPCRPK